MTDRTRFVLRFILGKYQGRELPVRMNRELIIGRSRDLDIPLVDDLVSRRHAKISATDFDVYIQDLGSTNGTFVNGKQVIGRARLHEGDRILVGSSIIRVAVAEGAAARATDGEASRWKEPDATPRPTVSGHLMSGAIDEIPLPDLLQLLSTSRKSGVLSINNGTSLGKIYFRKGAIYFATLDGDYALDPKQAIYSMLTWTTGTFELEPSVQLQVMEEIRESTEALLMEGMRRLDELRNPQRGQQPRGSGAGEPGELDDPDWE